MSRSKQPKFRSAHVVTAVTLLLTILGLAVSYASFQGDERERNGKAAQACNQLDAAVSGFFAALMSAHEKNPGKPVFEGSAWDQAVAELAELERTAVQSEDSDLTAAVRKVRYNWTVLSGHSVPVRSGTAYYSEGFLAVAEADRRCEALGFAEPARPTDPFTDKQLCERVLAFAQLLHTVTRRPSSTPREEFDGALMDVVEASVRPRDANSRIADSTFDFSMSFNLAYVTGSNDYYDAARKAYKDLQTTCLMQGVFLPGPP